MPVCMIFPEISRSTQEFRHRGIEPDKNINKPQKFNISICFKCRSSLGLGGVSFLRTSVDEIFVFLMYN